MKKDVTLKVKKFSSDSDEKYRITAAKEIEFVLRNVAVKGSRVALYFGAAKEFILTTLLHVDSHGLWLEQSKNSVTNQQIEADDDLIVVGSHDNVKIQFSAAQPAPVDYQGYPAFFLPLPHTLFRLQRREYFRLMTPVLNPLKCVIPVSDQNIDQPREITIMDISGGGVALTCEENNTELLPGKSYANCRIVLPEFGTISGTIVVRNLAVLTDALGKNYKRAGCELQDMDHPSAGLLHRYVMHLQRVK
ncbi:MAG: hypothetical protein GJU76_03485 [Gallionella sp.]|jgi:c-di-GMP-binding flagellar brake protein YcgR|nr:hypothetical protein [Gallionella sp.]